MKRKGKVRPIINYRHPRWIAKKLRVFSRDKWKCVWCGCKKRLECHHTYYKEGKDIWDYPLQSLLTVCHTCHEDFHRKQHEANKKVSQVEPVKTLEEKRKAKFDRMLEELSEEDKLLQKRYDAHNERLEIFKQIKTA